MGLVNMEGVVAKVRNNVVWCMHGEGDSHKRCADEKEIVYSMSLA